MTGSQASRRASGGAPDDGPAIALPMPPEVRWRAPYAVDPRASRGRLIPEAASPTRSPFQRDRDRVIHSTAFRRLKHKTQVFIEHEGDHFRTRLTHTIEVAQIARAIARALGLDEDLAEALALAHDLGHTPFGHTGEYALDRLMAPWGGFDHNAQALRIVTRLERRYATFDGLNLTWESLEGLVKHNGPLTDRSGRPVEKYAAHGIPRAIYEFDQLYPLDLWSQASAEAQVAAIADDIAYNAHDIDDGVRAGLITIADLRAVPWLASLLDVIDAAHPGLDPARTIHELVRRVITGFVEDVIRESLTRLDRLAPVSAAAVRASDAPVIAFSPPFAAHDRAIKGFLFPSVYRHPNVMRLREEATGIMDRLFEALLADPARLPEEWRAGLTGMDMARRARRVADYIAGMTDRFCLQEYGRLFDRVPELR
jgi:dGTPase